MLKKKANVNWQVFLGILLILTGGVFLTDLFLPGIKIMAYGWPIIVMLVGLVFFISMVLAGRRGAGLAIPGAVITGLGVLLFLQNTFNLWLTWTYAWALLISSIGIGLIVMNGYLKRSGLKQAGSALIGIGLVLFVIFGIFFEIILDISGDNNASVIFLSLGLVSLGIFIMFSRLLFRTRRDQPHKLEHDVVPSPDDLLNDLSGDPDNGPRDNVGKSSQ